MRIRLCVLPGVVALASCTTLFAAPAPVEIDPFAPGARVRVRTSLVVDLPGVVHMDGTRASAHGLDVVGESDIITVTTAAGRVVVPRPRTRWVGRLCGVEVDILRICVDGRPLPLTVPRGAVASLEVTRGRRTTIARNAGYGLVAGVVLALAINAIPHGNDSCDELCLDMSGYVRFWSTVTLGGAGLVIGGISGFGPSSYPWQRLELDRREAASPKRQVAVRFRF